MNEYPADKARDHGTGATPRRSLGRSVRCPGSADSVDAGRYYNTAMMRSRVSFVKLSQLFRMIATSSTTSVPHTLPMYFHEFVRGPGRMCALAGFHMTPPPPPTPYLFYVANLSQQVPQSSNTKTCECSRPRVARGTGQVLTLYCRAEAPKQ
eukprot:scaffold237028_cov30-Tisochrysis_lutea.AAC.1